MVTVIYYIEDEKDTTLSVIEAKTIKDFATKFCNIEEISIFASHSDQSIQQHLSKGYDKWKFIVVDEIEVKDIKLVINNL